MPALVLAGAGPLWCSALLWLQDPPPPPPGDPQDPGPTQFELHLERLLRERDDEVEDLRFRVETLEAEATRSRQTGPETQRLNVFNPQITVFGNFLARMDDREVYADDDPNEPRVDDTLRLREFEIDLRSAIDPWADGVLIASFESEVPGEFEAGVEEGYLTLKKLPVLDAAPAGLKLKMGRFRAEFGRFNKIHLHDLPQIDYPRSLRTVLGGEGYIQEGVSAQFFLPSPGESSTLEATVQLLGGGGAPIADGESASNLAGLAHLSWFQELAEAHTLEVGASAWSEESDRQLYGVDATYQWKPPASSGYRSFLVGGELFLARLDTRAIDENSHGFFVWSQYQLDHNTYLGVRYDRSQELMDSGLVTDTYSTFLTYYTTEFLRFRLGYEHAESDVAYLDDRDSGFLEINFVFGSHPVEPYWVNR